MSDDLRPLADVLAAPVYHADNGERQIDGETLLWRHEQEWPIARLTCFVHTDGEPVQVEVRSGDVSVYAAVGGTTVNCDLATLGGDVRLYATPVLEAEDPVVTVAREALGQQRDMPKIRVEYAVSAVGYP